MEKFKDWITRSDLRTNIAIIMVAFLAAVITISTAVITISTASDLYFILSLLMEG